MKPDFDLPLSTLLSHALVAFTIEFDNEFEHQMPHRTTNYGSTAGSRSGPWLVSLVMWSNCMQFVGEEGVNVHQLQELARTKTNLNGMQRWGYITIEEKVIRAKPKGRQAQQVWQPLFGVIEKRWEARFGKNEIDRLRESLEALIEKFDVDLPDCLPILGYGLFSQAPDTKRQPSPQRGLHLIALLSKALLAFAIEFERESDFSLAISANVLRVLDEKGVRVRDLPLLSGVSKEAISVAMGILQKGHAAVLESDGRTKIARLTPKGLEAQAAYKELLSTLEERWKKRFGTATIGALREALEKLAPHLFHGLEPYPEGWRASVRKPSTLPHYPMVLHRGGFPDGS